MSKHSPGPWKLRHNPNGTLGIEATELDGTRCQPVRINGDATDVVEGPITLANGRLVAAAPELYDALVRIRDKVASNGRLVGWNSSDLDWMNSVLAKVEGSGCANLNAATPCSPAPAPGTGGRSAGKALATILINGRDRNDEINVCTWALRLGDNSPAVIGGIQDYLAESIDSLLADKVAEAEMRGRVRQRAVDVMRLSMPYGNWLSAQPLD